MTSINKLRNLGLVSQTCLQAVGINNIEDLRRVGAVKAFLAVKEDGYNPSLNFVYAMEAGLRGIHVLKLSQVVKTKLKNQLISDAKKLT